MPVFISVDVRVDNTTIMGRVRYIPNQHALDHYYRHQTGDGGVYFQGPTYQRGHGLGGLFGRLFRAAVPLLKNTVAPALKKGAKAVAREALSTGVGVLEDVIEGESAADSINRRVPEAARDLARRGIRRTKKMIDNPRRPAKRRRSKSIKGRDIFDG